MPAQAAVFAHKLFHHNPQQRLQSALALIRQPDPEAIPHLLKCVIDNDPRFRVAVYRALLQHSGNPLLMDGLLQLLQSKNLAKHKVACMLLGKLPPIGEDALIPLAFSASARQTAAVLNLLARLPHSPAINAVFSKALQHCHQKVVVAAIRCIGFSGNMHWGSDLVAKLQQPAPIKQAALAAIATLNYYPALPAIAELVEKADAQSSALASRVLLQLLKSATWEQTIALLQNCQDTLLIHLAIARADKNSAIDLPRERLAMAVSQALARPLENIGWLQQIITAAALIGAKAFTGQLLAMALHDELHGFAAQLIAVLEHDGDQNALQAGLRHPNRNLALWSALALNLERGKAFLRHCNWQQLHCEARAALALRLGSWGREWALPILQNMLQDEEPTVREKAIGALGHLGLAQAVETLKPYLHNQIPAIVQATAEALATMEHASASQALEDGLASPHALTRQCCLLRLNEQLPPWLPTLASDPHAEVRLALLNHILLLDKPDWFLQIKERAIIDQSVAVRKMAMEMCAQWDRHCLPALTRIAMSGDKQLSLRAIELMGQIPDENAAEALYFLLFSLNGDKKIAALNSLAQRPRQGNSLAAFGLLNANSARVRKHAEKAIMETGAAEE